MAWKISDDDLNKVTIFPKNGIVLCEKDLQKKIFGSDILLTSDFKILKKLNNECWKIFERIEFSSLPKLIDELCYYKSRIEIDEWLEILEKLINIAKEALNKKYNLLLTGD